MIFPKFEDRIFFPFFGNPVSNLYVCLVIDLLKSSEHDYICCCTVEL